ncbi:MAG: hypothetical protein IPM53_17525 [Anaerolineaceae bacterium]|nr:hypothetical protein [Anaerolineaceae bacterium]
MKNGICPKCSSTEVYRSKAKTGLEYGLVVDRSTPLLNIYKDKSWWPDVTMLYMDFFVCRDCGCFEMYVQDIEKLDKLEDCTNWIKAQ